VSAPPRILMWGQSLWGFGHAARLGAVAAALTRAGAEVHIAWGGAAKPPGEAAPGAHWHALPPIHAAPHAPGRLLDETGRPADAALHQTRRDLLLELFERSRPQVVVVEGFPLSRRKFAPELRPLLERSARHSVPRLGLVRDIPEPPKTAEKSAALLALAGELIDRILVAGDPRLIDLQTVWPQTAQMNVPLDYVGYIHRLNAPAPLDLEARRDGLVSAGAAGSVLARLMPEVIGAFADMRWRMVGAQSGPMVEAHRADFPAMLAAARVSVQAAGYNTVAEALALRTPMVVVPDQPAGEIEQDLRADALVAAGLALRADPAAEDLRRAIAECLAEPPAPRLQPELQGAQTAAKAILAAAAGA